MSFKVERLILDDTGKLVSYTFEFEDVSVGDATRLADMLKWNAECDFGHHRENGTPKRFSHDEIEYVRERSRCLLLPEVKRAA